MGIPQPPAHEQQSQQAAELQQQSGRHVFSVNAPIDRHQLYDTARCIAPSGKPALTHVEVSNAVCLRVCCLWGGGALLLSRHRMYSCKQLLATKCGLAVGGGMVV